MDLLDSYIESLYLKDKILLEFDLDKISKKLTPESKLKNWFSNYNSAVKKQNGKEVVNQLKKLPIPKMTLATIDKVASTTDKAYKKRQMMSTRVLENSLPNATSKSIDFAASFLSLLSSIKTNKNDNLSDSDRLKKYLKEFVTKSRKFMDEHEDELEKKDKRTAFQKEDLPDLAVAWTIVAMTTGLGVGLSVFIMFSLPKLILILGLVSILAVVMNLGVILGR